MRRLGHLEMFKNNPAADPRPKRTTQLGRGLSRPVPGKLDKGIRLAVERLQACGIETCQSCEGGPGHSYPEPTVEFYGGPEAGWRAVGACLAYGLPIMTLNRKWDVSDRIEVTGPIWEIIFRPLSHPAWKGAR